jgi:hypothetical protein
MTKGTNHWLRMNETITMINEMTSKIVTKTAIVMSLTTEAREANGKLEAFTINRDTETIAIIGIEVIPTTKKIEATETIETTEIIETIEIIEII